MAKLNDTGVYQLSNGKWGFRYVVSINGKRKEGKKTKDVYGNPLKTKREAIKARQIAITYEQEGRTKQQLITRKTVEETFNDYCETGRSGKAYSTIKKQDSLWKNHLFIKFGSRYVDDISVAEIQDYLAFLYYTEDRAYSYVESFLKMFYLIFGQAYSRNFIEIDLYNKLCVNKDSKIHMPKMKIDEEIDIVSFGLQEIQELDLYFNGTNAQTAYMIGKYCGLRINECYGLKWSNINIDKGIITIDRQMQYQDGLIKLVSLKTRNAKRKVYMCSELKKYLTILEKQNNDNKTSLQLQREQNQTIIYDIDGLKISSLELVNSLPNGKIQTVNSMKYHSRILKDNYHINFKFHYLRHTYGTRLAEWNTPVHLLCNQMGHSNSNVTQKYYIAMSERGIELLIKNLEQM